MEYKIFLDTNILLDFFDDKRINYKEAVSIIEAAENDFVNCFVSESVLNATIYVAIKALPKVVLVNMLQHLLSFIQILPATNEVYNKAFVNAKNDIEDAVLYQIALNNKLDYFITNDLKDFRKIEAEALPVVQAKEFLKHI